MANRRMERRFWGIVCAVTLTIMFGAIALALGGGKIGLYLLVMANVAFGCVVRYTARTC